jgi:hypothetical protein
MSKLPTAPLVGELLQISGLVALVLGLIAARHHWRIVAPMIVGVVALAAGRRLRRL